MPQPLNYAIQAEESHMGIQGDGWDNFLLNWECGELPEYAKILKSVRAKGCLAVIEELIAWVESEPGELPDDRARGLAVSERAENRARLDALWERYLAASQDENPVGRAQKKFPKRKNKFPVTDREYYDFFGTEAPNTKCRAENCARGTVQNSVFCRTHHFESVFRKPCPWTD